MSPNRSFIPALIIAVLFPALGRAAWSDRQQGSPALEFYPNRVIGATPQTTTMVQDAHGRLYVGSDALLVFDGVTWTSHPLPDSYNLAALCFGPDQKLWAGAYNQVGYYSETAHGVFTFTSLVPKIPAEHRRIESTWGCGFVGAQLYFICHVPTR